MAGGMTKAATVRGDDIISSFGERRNDLAPGVGEFREAVQEDDKGSISGGGVVGFKDVDRERVVGGGKGDMSRGYDRMHAV